MVSIALFSVLDVLYRTGLISFATNAVWEKQALSRVERSVYLYNSLVIITMRIILTLAFFVSIHFQLLSQHCESTVIIELKIHGRQSENCMEDKMLRSHH
jgi:hypothetical protein